jgi:8-oxo-dGTP pyrophosphatase MutT (NUDIX family)
MERTIARLTLPFYQLYWRVTKPETTRVRVLLVCGDQILLVKHLGKKYWNIPSGEVEQGESLYEALVRELKEELGISVCTITKKLGTYRQTTKSRNDVVHVFVATVPQKTPIHLEWEIVAARWYGLTNLPIPVQPGARRRIQEYIANKHAIYSVW